VYVQLRRLLDYPLLNVACHDNNTMDITSHHLDVDAGVPERG
jgi:hypothetical protein